MPQLAFNNRPIPAVPGMPFDGWVFQAGDLVSGIAASIIPPGVMCELNSSGYAQPIQDIHSAWPPSGAANATSLYGISLFGTVSAEQAYTPPPVPASTTGSTFAGYQKGDVVTFVRRGRIWMAFDGGGTIARIGPFNLWHSSDGTHPQGVATFTGVASTAGAEIDTCPQSMECWNPLLTAGVYTDNFGNSAGILCVNINLPGYGS